MLIRPLAAVVFTAALVACTTPAASDAGSSKSAQTDGDGAKTGSKAGTTTETGDSSSAIDGTWDITADGLAPSSIAFNGSKIAGTLIMADEGEDSADCFRLQDRITFSFTVSGNELTGSAKTDIHYSPECGGDEHSTTTIRATRSKAPSASAKTPFEGDWQVSTDNGDPIAVKIAGMVLKMWGAQDSSDDEPGVVMNIDGRDATGSGQMSFSARRR